MLLLFVLPCIRGLTQMDGKRATCRQGSWGGTPGEQSFLLPGVAGDTINCCPLHLCPATIPNPSLGAGSLPWHPYMLQLRGVLHLFPGTAQEGSLWISLPIALGSTPLTCAVIWLWSYIKATQVAESTKALGKPVQWAMQKPYTSLNLFSIRSKEEKETEQKRSANFGRLVNSVRKNYSKDSFSLGARLETQGRRKEKKLTWIGVGSQWRIEAIHYIATVEENKYLPPRDERWGKKWIFVQCRVQIASGCHVRTQYHWLCEGESVEELRLPNLNWRFINSSWKMKAEFSFEKQN